VNLDSLLGQFKLGFTGTRQGMTKQQRTALTQLFLSAKPGEFHHGGAQGADTEAHTLLINMLHIGVIGPCVIHIHPGNTRGTQQEIEGYWALRMRKGDVVHRCQPPLVRNVDIVVACDSLVAVPQTAQERLRSGTWATVRRARKVHKLLGIINPDGTIVHGTPLL
jgi:hypothetical protein